MFQQYLIPCWFNNKQMARIPAAVPRMPNTAPFKAKDSSCVKIADKMSEEKRRDIGKIGLSLDISFENMIKIQAKELELITSNDVIIPTMFRMKRKKR